MLSARHRFPSRGTAASRVQVGPMAMPAPAEAPSGPQAGSGVPPQDLVGTGIREMFVAMLDSAAAIRVGANSHGNPQTTYEGTVLPEPVDWATAHTAEVNGEENLRAGAQQAGNSPQMTNKTISEGSEVEVAPLRPAAQLPAPGRR